MVHLTCSLTSCGLKVASPRLDVTAINCKEGRRGKRTERETEIDRRDGRSVCAKERQKRRDYSITQGKAERETI